MSNRSPKEDGLRLRKSVSSWLLAPSGLNCLSLPNVPKGLSNPRPDVIGISHSGGYLAGDSELIAVQVRTSPSRFISTLGDAYACSVFAGRVYCAFYLGEANFSEEQIEAALHLRVGLIRVDSDFSCQRTLPAPSLQPIERFRLRLIDELGLATCQLCAIVFPSPLERENEGSLFWNEVWAEHFGRLRNESVYDRRALCPDCLRNLEKIAAERDG